MTMVVGTSFEGAFCFFFSCKQNKNSFSVRRERLTKSCGVGNKLNE